MTDNDLAAIVHQVMAKNGSEYMCLDPIITIGPQYPGNFSSNNFHRTINDKYNRKLSDYAKRKGKEYV